MLGRMGVARPGVVEVLLQVHVEARSRHAATGFAAQMEMPAFDPQQAQRRLEPGGLDAEVHHGPEKHIPADPAEEVQIEGLHCSSPLAKALIWLAA
jgi:hypothetical protein